MDVTLGGLVALLAIGRAAASQVIVGGVKAGWTTGIAYDPVNVTTGDSLVFNYARGQHNVVQVATPDCTFANATQIAGLTETPFNLTLKWPGTFYYACSVSGHCDEGMLLTVHVSDHAPAAAERVPPTTDSKGQAKEPPTAGASKCTPPVLVPGTNDTYHVSCLSPRVPLSPGQVANNYYNLANPYPNRVVAIVNETSQIVDATGRPVPLSEAYAHHFFGNARFVVAEGAELRGTLDKKPLPEPYHYLVNGTFFDDPANRRMNIHLINTVGVEEADIARCIECWCLDAEAAFRGNYYGGTACCSPLNCPTNRGSNPPTIYFLQYNVSYRDPEDIKGLIQASPVLLDVVNGSVEYDVFAKGPGSEDVRNLTQAFDAQCPQTVPYGLLRCTGHQHIGGKCMEIIDSESGQIICSSCSQYGNSTSHDTAGEEKGYLVRMTDDTLVPPYQLQPGHSVTIVSKYDAFEQHYGVMALWILTVTNWDPTCPGGGAMQDGTPGGSFDVYTTFAGPAGGAVPNATAY